MVFVAAAIVFVVDVVQTSFKILNLCSDWASVVSLHTILMLDKKF